MIAAAPYVSPEELRRQAMEHSAASPIYSDEDLRVIEGIVFEYLFNPMDTGAVPQPKKIRTVCARRLFYGHAKKNMVQNSKGIWSHADRYRTELAKNGKSWQSESNWKKWSKSRKDS